MRPGHVYIVWPRVCQRLNENIYKIGRTGRSIDDRLTGYPKHTKEMFSVEVEDQVTMETYIRNAFNEKFECEYEEYGSEYFRGDLNEMIKLMKKIVCGDFRSVSNQQQQGVRNKSKKTKCSCPCCGKIFANKYNLYYHQNETKMPCNLRCRKCGQRQSSKKKYKMHFKDCEVKSENEKVKNTT